MYDLLLKTCAVEGAVEVRLLHPSAHRPAVTRLLDLTKIEEAKAVILYDVEESKTYMA